MTTVQVQTQVPDRDELMRLVPSKSFRLVKFFENIAKDVSVTIPDAIGQSIQGPTSGVVDRDVVIFDGTSGFAVKSGGITIDELAPLDSPDFTGVPTAPTASPGTATGQIATTAFVDASGTGFVRGPVISVNDRVATFNGVTGKVIKDSGVLISTLAPLASPAFTGNPTAPNQALGDNDTSIANTAFVQAAISDLSTNTASFSAHNNGVGVSIPSAVWTKVTFSTESFDVGSRFASSTWTPPAGRLVMIVGSVAFNTVLNQLMSVSVYKNGAMYKQGVMFPAGGANVGQVTVTCIDIPNGTDTYELYAYQGTGVAQNTGISSTATYFQGTTIQA